ncbi:hypothetical protein JCM11251_001318 [Rhodosporidiobolus azoricus]
MPKFVVFEGAPTVQQCLEAVQLPAGSRGSWRTFPVGLSAPRSTTPPPRKARRDEDSTGDRARKRLLLRTTVTQSEAQEEDDDVKVSQFADADTTGLFSAARQAAVVPSSQPDGNDDHFERQTKRIRQEEQNLGEDGEEGGDDANGTTPASALLPPPSQVNPRLSRLIRRNRFSLAPSFASQNRTSRSNLPLHLAEISNVSSTYTEEGATYDSTMIGDVRLGPPPEFVFGVHQLIAVNQLRNHVGRKAHVLACVLDYTAADEGSKAPSSVSLIDHSGQTTKLIAWKDTGRELLKQIRRGDVVYAGPVAVKEYQAKTQLTYDDRESCLYIYWRSMMFDVDELEFNWDEKWVEAEVAPQAKRVFEEVNFFRQFTIGA